MSISRLTLQRLRRWRTPSRRRVIETQSRLNELPATTAILTAYYRFPVVFCVATSINRKLLSAPAMTCVICACLCACMPACVRASELWVVGQAWLSNTPRINRYHSATMRLLALICSRSTTADVIMISPHVMFGRSSCIIMCVFRT